MALFLAEVKKNRESTYTKRLLNNNNVVDYFQTASGTTIFYYDNKQGRRDKTAEYEFNGARSAFRALLDDKSDSDFLTLTVNKINGLTPSITRYEINEDNVIEGVNIDQNTSVLKVARGAFEIVKFEVPYRIEEINAVASVSGSFSFS